MRPLGRSLSHLGFVLLALGVVGSRGLAVENKDVTVREGETVEALGRPFKYLGYTREKGKDFGAVTVRVALPASDDTLLLQRRLYDYWERPIDEIDILPSLAGDFYVAFAGLDEDGTAHFSLHWLPWIVLLWVGSGALMLGGSFSLLSSLTARGAKRKNSGIGGKT